MIEQYISPCKSCNGTGIKTEEFSSIKSWGGEFCEKCKGIGYEDWKSNKDFNRLFKVCDNCNGFSTKTDINKCSKCHGEGIVDWMTAIKLGIK